MGHRKRKKAGAALQGRGPSTDAFKPFEQLKTMLEEKAISLPQEIPKGEETPPLLTDPEPPEDDMTLFRRAMADVTPLPRKGCRRIPPRRRQSPLCPDFGDLDSMKRLRNLVDHGKGFVVADTPEYIEGVRYCDNPEIARRLHQGDFSIQSHIDLHGMITADAAEALEGFLKDAVTSGKRAVLVVHGRGLSSPGKPVLKAMVQEWLTCGPWRKWVIAFSSARACDGGAGATYVLLRRSPCTRRFRKSSGVRP